eukprot:m.943920 g.943920  ORF g.943920 m.943920 type:complete len:361 (+) comp23841_c0_seq9:104-1186(+)
MQEHAVLKGYLQAKPEMVASPKFAANSPRLRRTNVQRTISDDDTEWRCKMPTISNEETTNLDEDDTVDTLTKDLEANTLAGLTVGFVNVPLSISLAVASAATPSMGTATAIYGGFFGALFGGSVYNIQGPTGSLSPILAYYSVSYGQVFSWCLHVVLESNMQLCANLSALARCGVLSVARRCQGVLPWLAIGAGLLALLAYCANFQRLCRFISLPVMEGFNLGVSFTIACNQIPYGLGLLGLGMHKHRHLYNNLREFWAHLPDADPFQSAVTLLGVVALLLLNRHRPDRPWFVLLVRAGTMLARVGTSWYYVGTCWFGMVRVPRQPVQLLVPRNECWCRGCSCCSTAGALDRSAHLPCVV